MIQGYTQQEYKPIRKNVSASDHARTAATAIFDALLPRKKFRRRHSQCSPALTLQHHNPFEASLPTSSFAFKHTLSSIAFDTSPEKLSVTRLGHSSILINFFGTIILADPVLSMRVGVEVLSATIGIDRYVASLLDFEQIPKPDIILLSHAHFDHTDLPTLRRFAHVYHDSITVICAKNTSDVIESLPWKRVIELDWDEEQSLNGVSVRAMEVVHNGWRCPWERDRANGYTESGRSYNAYFLEKHGKRIVFGGDTAWTECFSDLKQRGVNIAFMPIGAYQGYESLHCTPEEALAMAESMNAEILAPMHFGAFYQSNEEPTEPLERLLRKTSLYRSRIALTELGQSLTLA